MKKLYAIRDDLAMELGSPVVHVMAHDAQAIRFFGDVASQRDTSVGRHTKDFSLICLGDVAPDGTVSPEEEGGMLTVAPRIVLTGEKWLASQPVARATT